MTTRQLWTASTLSALLLFAAVSSAADDAFGDAIPEGAKFRLGTGRLRSPNTGSPSAMTADGKFLVGSTNDGMGFVDVTGKIDHTVRLQDYGTVIAFSGDGKRALSAGYPAAFVWETEKGKTLAKAEHPAPNGDHGVSLAADGKRFAIGGVKSFNEKDKDKLPTVVVWDVDGKKQLSKMTPAQNETIFVAISPNGKHLATWGYHYDANAKEAPKPEADPSRLVQFWDAAEGKEVAKARLLTGNNPQTAAFAPDGSVVAISGGDGAIHLFDPATGTAKGLLLGRSRQGRKIAFSPDGKTLAAAGEDGSVQRWSLPDGKRLGTTEAPVGQPFYLRGIQFTDNERVVVWGQRNVATIVWDAPGGKLLTPAGGNTSSITSAAVTGGKEILTGASDGVIIRWDPTNGKEIGTLALKGPSGGFGSGVVTGPVTFSPDGSRALAHDFSGGIAVYDLPAGTQQFVIPGDFNRDTRGVFSQDGSKILLTMTSYDAIKNPSRVAVWDLATAKKLGEVEVPRVGQITTALSPDGKSIMTAGIRRDEKGEGNGEFVVTGWEVGSGKKRGEYSEPAGFGQFSVAALADNKTVVVNSPKTGGVLVLDYFTGTKVRDLDLGGKRTGIAAVVSPDGKTVAVPLSPGFGAKATASIMLFDSEGTKAKKTLAGVSNPSVVAFSADGKTLITGSIDSTALVWDIGEK